MRILEIGGWSYFKQEYPQLTTLLWAGRRPPFLAAGTHYLDCTPRRFFAAIRDVNAGRYDLVVAYAPLRPAWHPRYWARSLGREPQNPVRAFTRVWGTSWLRFVNLSVPLIVIDANDAFIFGRHNFFLLDKADIVFKRELPADRWHILCHSAHPALPTRRIRRDLRWQQRLEKIQPLGLPADVINTNGVWEGEFPEKKVDIFFSGNVAENSWVRRTGVPELRELQARGFVVDISNEFLPRTEFYRRLSRAWLAWSPMGYSWDCFRTSEAAQCLSVPVVNMPTVERYRPLRHGEHVIYYEIEPGGLSRAVEANLADKGRLKSMALAARQHVLCYHTGRKLIDHVIESVLSPSGKHNAEGRLD